MTAVTILMLSSCSQFKAARKSKGIENPGSIYAVDTQAKAENSLDAGEHTVKLNNMKLWYKVSGTGPVCLMPSPAWGPGSDLYYRTLQSMEKYFTVVYIDSRGTGRSGRAKTTKEYTWDHLVGDLEALRTHFRRDSIWLMGHSAGGAQILHYASKYPKRVSGLILISTGAVNDDKHVADFNNRMTWRKGEPWYDEAFKAWHSNPKNDEEMKEWIKMTDPFYWSNPMKSEQFQDDLSTETFSSVALKGEKESNRFPYDLRASLKKVTAPALIIVGDDDFISSPESATIMHLALPNSKLLLIEECGHFPWLEQKDVFEERVPQFLQALRSDRE
jgi:proline iminopeptidase